MSTKPPFLAYRSFYTPLNTIEKFNAAGYDTVCLFPAHTLNSRGTPYSQYPPVWRWFDRLDFAPLDEMIHNVTLPMPEAKFLCMVDLNSPAWLEHMFQHDCCDTFNNLGKAIHNPHWLEATAKYLEAFLRYADAGYGSRIQAYILACGGTDEWYDYSLGSEDPHRREAWRQWCLKKGLPDPVDIPPASVRDHISHENLLRDPVTDQTALDYWRFCNESVADAVLHFAAVTRKVIGRKADIGCFFGYLLEQTARTLVSCGHLDYERLLDSPEIDFAVCPGTYEDRHIGGGSGFLTPHGSITVRGKRLLHECDQRTNTYNSYLAPGINLRLDSAWPDERSTVAGLKRETALGLIHRTHLWWFDMWGDYYQGEAVMNTLARAREIWSRYAAAPAVEVSEIAMIVDADSTYFLNQDHPAVPEINVGTRTKLNRSGAPYQIYSFNDLPRIEDFSRYKLVIFTSLFHLTPVKREVLQQYVLREGRTVLWLGPAGIIADGKYAEENCEKLTGIPRRAEGTQKAAFGNWNSVSLRDYRQLTPALLKEIAREAGVHLYTCREWPVYAEGPLLAVHTAAGGREELSVKVPSGTAIELFTGKEYPIRNGKFTCDFLEPDTAFFAIGSGV